MPVKRLPPEPPGAPRSGRKGAPCGHLLCLSPYPHEMTGCSLCGALILLFAIGFGVNRAAVCDVYVADQNNNQIKLIPNGVGTPTTIGSGFNAPQAVVLTPQGDILVADTRNNAV